MKSKFNGYGYLSDHSENFKHINGKINNAIIPKFETNSAQILGVIKALLLSIGNLCIVAEK